MRRRWWTTTRAAAATLVASVCLGLPAAVRAQPAQPQADPAQPALTENVAPPPDYLAMGVDLLFVRPLGLTAVVAGAVLFVPAAALSAPLGKDGFQEAYELFIGVPVEETFQRKLGDF